MLGREFQIFAVKAAIRVLVFDTHIRELHPPVFHGQVMRGGPVANLFGRAVRASGRPAIAAVVGLKEPLIFAFQLVVEEDSPDTRATVLQPLGGLAVRSIQLSVMPGFAGLDQTGIELLPFRAIRLGSMVLEEFLALLRQRQQRSPLTISEMWSCDLDQIEISEPRNVAPASVGSVVEIARIHHAEGADRAQHLHLRCLELVAPILQKHAFSGPRSREIEIAGEGASDVGRIGSTSVVSDTVPAISGWVGDVVRAVVVEDGLWGLVN